MRLLTILAALLLFAAEAGAARLTDQHNGFTLTAPAQVALCVTQDNCGPARSIAAGVFTNCGIGFTKPDGQPSVYPSPAGQVALACFTIEPVAALEPAERCWSLNPFAYKHDVLPAGVSGYYTRAVTWLGDCTPAELEVVLYNEDEMLAAFSALAGTFSRDNANAYVRSQPVRALTASERAFAQSLRVKYAAPPVVAPPPPVYVVRQISSGTRPYYAPNATSTGIGKKLGDVATLTACDSTKRLGTTSYYFVPSVAGYAVCVAQ